MTFSITSKNRLATVNQKLQDIFNISIRRTPVDFGIAFMGGLRTEDEQHELFVSGKSLKDGYRNKSKHQLGDAVDFIPHVNGQYSFDMRYYLIIIGVIFSCANELDIKIRSGANWDRDETWIDDQNFKDFPHIELI